jgi:hypothetical protein
MKCHLIKEEVNTAFVVCCIRLFLFLKHVTQIPSVTEFRKQMEA